MSKSLPYVLLLVWFSLVIIFNNLQFHRGFLLSKNVIEKNATCVSYTEEYVDNEPMCIKQKARVLLLVIDAFRYDFALHDKGIVDPLPYENKIPVLSELLTSKPNNTRLYRFLADPPTTTMQRLKALTTGSLPTFTDAGANFASTEITEDNLISQLVAHNKKVVFMGDDTWTSLYPRHFLRQYPFPSFDVMDLDTVDNGVNANIHDELKRDDWDLLVAHYLGVDHCGHKFGPDHKEMARKLTEMNDVIRKVVDNLSENTVLMVIGDHGMTVTGDHGGDSELEISSALFVYSKQPLGEHHHFDDNNITSKDVNQVDLTPTLATILGVPIPYGNIGSLLPDCVPGITRHELITSVWHNVRQIVSYVKKYQEESPDSFNPDDLKKMKRQYDNLQALRVENGMVVEKYISEARKFLGEVRSMCREVWVEFNPFFMARGLLFSAVISFFVYAMLDGLPNSERFFEFCRNSASGMYVGMIVGGVIAYGGYTVGYFDNFLMTAIFISGLISVFMLPVFLCVYWEEVTVNWHEHRKAFAVDEFVSRIAILISCFAFFSNSYIISEAYVTFSIMCAVFAFIVFESWTKLRKTIVKPLIILTISFFVFSRITFHYWQCREEHNCGVYTAVKKDTDSQTDWLISVISVGIIVVVSRAWLKYCGNLSSTEPSVLAFRYTLPVITFCTAAFWAVSCFPGRIVGVPKWTTDSFAQAAYLLIFSGLSLIFLFPNTVYVFYNRHLTGAQDGNVIAHLFRNVRSMFNREENDDRVPMAWGLATAYSAPFVMALTYLVLLFCLLLGIGSAPSALMLFLSMFVVLAVSSIVRYEKAATIEQMIHVPSSLVVLWAMMASYYFFATGHQATFPNIPWKAAFVGTGGGAFRSNIVPGALVITNIFGSYFLMGFTVPLLQLAPLTLYKMIPHLGMKTTNEKKDVAKGEMAVFQSEDFLLSSTTKLCFKYLIFHVARLLATMLSATIHCRHLMVWRVFTPRLIFESVAMLVTFISVLLGYIFYVRIVKSIERLVKGIDKQSR